MRFARLLVSLTALVSLGFPVAAFAGSSCPAHFHTGAQPQVPANLSAQSRELCYRNFALLHSGQSRTAIWSAEFLTRSNILSARQIERTSTFFADPNLPRNERSELADYKGSGFDRGHLAPSGNMPNQSAQQQSFTLANIIPQTAKLNRYAWKSLEGDVRKAVVQHGSAYVVTGPLFVGKQIRSLRGRVLVPTHVWKAVYIPRKGAVVLVSSNSENPNITRMSVSNFARTYAINPFPALRGTSRDSVLQL